MSVNNEMKWMHACIFEFQQVDISLKYVYLNISIEEYTKGI